MSQIEVLQKMLVDMEKNINQLDHVIQQKESLIKNITVRIDELNLNLITEKNELLDAQTKREKILEMQSEVQSNYNQINENVNTLIEILSRKI